MNKEEVKDDIFQRKLLTFEDFDNLISKAKDQIESVKKSVAELFGDIKYITPEQTHTAIFKQFVKLFKETENIV